MYLLVPFILQNFKKILSANPELWGCAIFEPKMTHLSWTRIFWYKHYDLLALFTVWNLKKLLQQIQSYEDAPFWTQNGPFAPIFFWKIINIILIHLLAPFIVHSFKKILPANPELWGCTIFGPKRAYFPKWEFLSEIKVRY